MYLRLRSVDYGKSPRVLRHRSRGNFLFPYRGVTRQTRPMAGISIGGAPADKFPTLYDSAAISSAECLG